MTSFISGQKILLGIPNCCYQWLFMNTDSVPRRISLSEASELAARSNARVQIDTRTGASYFAYTDEGGVSHTVWCGSIGDTRSVLELADIYDLAGISYRMLDQFRYPATWR